MNQSKQELLNIPEQYRGYFILKTDPFHDDAFSCQGSPTDVRGESVVLTVKAEATINAATFGLSSASGGDKWDVNIASLPVSQEFKTLMCNRYEGAHISNGSLGLLDISFGPLTAHGVNSGDDTFTVDASSLAEPFFRLGTGNPLDYETNGQKTHRRAIMLTQAIEVQDITPQYYKQGSCTVYSQPSTLEDTNYYCNVTFSAGASRMQYLQSGTDMSLPPNSVNQAVRLPGSRTWDAKQGAYVINRDTAENQPILWPSQKWPFVRGTPTANGTTLGIKNYFPQTWCNNAQDISTKSFVLSNAGYKDVLVAKYNTAGAYFTGLSKDNTTLRVRLIQSYEVFPSLDDSSLLPLTSPTLPKNDFVESLIRKIVQTQPAGYMQTDNPKGEIWRKILSTASKILDVSSPVVSLYQPEIGAGMASISYGLKQVDKKPKKPRPNAKAKAKTSKTLK